MNGSPKHLSNSCNNSKNDLGKSIYEALREKIELLGGFQGILLKFHILKIKFLHEKILFFALDFFPDKVWLCNIRK